MLDLIEFVILQGNICIWCSDLCTQHVRNTHWLETFDWVVITFSTECMEMF